MVVYLDKKAILWSLEEFESAQSKTPTSQNHQPKEEATEGVNAISRLDYVKPLASFKSNGILTSVDAHPFNSDLFAFGSIDKYIRIYSAKADRIIDWYQSEDYITSVNYAPDGRQLLVGFSHGLCRLYSLEPYLIFRCEVVCHNSNIRELDARNVVNTLFLDNGSFIVNSSDSRIRLFRETVSYQLEMKYKGHSSSGQLMRADADK
jgi:WD40 repeat protein